MTLIHFYSSYLLFLYVPRVEVHFPTHTSTINQHNRQLLKMPNHIHTNENTFPQTTYSTRHITSQNLSRNSVMGKILYILAHINQTPNAMTPDPSEYLAAILRVRSDLS